MANITPVVSNSQALITPGWPLVQVAQSNPVAAKQLAEGTTSTPGASTVIGTSLKQSGHTADRVI